MKQLRAKPQPQPQFRGKYPVLAPPTSEMSDVIKWRMWDSVRYQAGFAMPGDPIEMFVTQRGQKTFVANNQSVEYKKRNFDTSLDNNNQIPKGKQFVINSIQASVTNLGNLPASTGTGDNIGLPINPGGPGGTNNFGAITSASNLMQAILYTVFISTEFGQTDKRYEEGPLLFFPTRYGATGFAALAAQPDAEVNNSGLGQGVTNAHSEVWVQNGALREEPLAFDRVLESLDTIKITLTSYLPFVPNQDFQIFIILDGYLQRPV